MKQLLFLDFETYWNTSIKYGLKDMSMVEYIRDPRFKSFGMAVAELSNDTPRWVSANQIIKFINMVAREVGWPNVTVVGHNIKFDAMILHEIYEVIPGKFIDTKGMSKAVLGKSIKSHHLAELAEHFGLQSKGIMQTDGKIVLTDSEEKELAEYCIHDVELCREIYNRLAKDFPENQYEALHRTVDMFVNPKLELNVPLLQETSIKEASRRANIFTEIGIEKAQFSSNIKFPALLVSKGYEVPTKRSPKRTNEDGTPKEIPAIALGDPEFLEMLEGENEELRTLCEARAAAKSTLLETRSTKLAAIGATGRWPFDVEFSGADQTHRFSGGSGAGGNPQNFTRNSALREAVCAPNGYELVIGDFSNIELRLVAYLSKDSGLVQSIEQGIDIYCDFASVFFGKRITKADKAERQFGKTAILGLGYGMGWKKFIKTVRIQTGQTISEENSKKAVELYRTRYSKVQNLWNFLDSLIPEMLDSRLDYKNINLPVSLKFEGIELPSGLKIRFPNLRQEKGERGRMEWVYDVWQKRHFEQRKLYGGKVLENISQGLAGELCKEAMLKMGDNVTGLVHDEIHVICKKGLGQVTAAKLKRVMSTPPDWMPEIRLDAEVGMGQNWAAAK